MNGAALAKAAVIAVRNKDKAGKIAMAAVAALFLPFLLIVISLLSLVLAFLPNGIVMDTKTYDISNTAIYKEVNPIVEEYMEEVKQKIEKKKEKLIKKNTVEKVEDDGNGNEVKTKECKMTIHKKYDRSIIAYLIAYLLCSGKLEEKTGKVDQEEAKSFLRKIGRIKIKKISDSEYDIYNTYLKPKKIANRYFQSDTEKSKFCASCSAYQAFFGANEIEIDTEEIDISEIQNVNVSLLEMPLYLQYSGPWASVPYGNGTISGYGCCPTCLAMVLSYMKQQVILPNHIVEWTGNRYYVPGAGSSWSIFPAVAQQWGVTCTNLGNNPQAMVEALQNGKPVISSMRPGTFTRGGHFIVLTGITENSGIRVNDPNDNSTKNFKDREFELSLITREAKNYWSFE